MEVLDDRPFGSNVFGELGAQQLPSGYFANELLSDWGPRPHPPPPPPHPILFPHYLHDPMHKQPHCSKQMIAAEAFLSGISCRFVSGFS